MDINKLYTSDAHEEGAEMQVIGLDGKHLECWITVAGLDSKRYRKALRDNRRSLIEKAANRKDGDDEIDTEESTADTLARATIGWRGFTDNGEELEFSTELAKQLYLSAPYIADQVDAFSADRANFIKG